MKIILGVTSALLFIIAGILEIGAGKPIIGTLFILAAIANVIVFWKLQKLNRK